MSVDADGIIINQLSILGYKQAGAIQNLSAITTDKMIDVLRFLFSLFPDIGKTPPPPKSSATLYKYATDMIEKIVAKGYPTSLGYDAILYPQIEKTRAVISFLLEKVPRSNNDVAKSVAVTSPSALAIKAAQDEFNACKTLKVRSYVVQSLKEVLKPAGIEDSKKIAEFSLMPKQPFIEEPILPNSGIPFNTQLKKNSLASLLAFNDREVDIDQFDFSKEKPSTTKLQNIASRAFQVSSTPAEVVAVAMKPTILPSTKARSRIANQARFDYHSQDTKIGQNAASTLTTAAVASTTGIERSASKDKVDLAEKVEEAAPAAPVVPKLTVKQEKQIREEQSKEMVEIRELINRTESSAAEIESQIESNKDEIKRINELLETVKEENTRLANEVDKATKMAEIAKSDPTQIRALQRDFVDSMASLLEIAREFEPKRSALINEYRSLSTAIRTRTDDYQRQMTKLAKLKRQIQEGEAKLATDAEAISNLEKAMENRGEQKPRSHYIDSIFQIIKTIEKQEADVERIRSDIRNQHNTMNNTISKVKRTWMYIDEMVYTEAKTPNGEWAKMMYKTIVELLVLFEGISEGIETSGKISAQIMELDTKIDRAETQIDRNALERIEEDLANVKKEIAARSK
ncbi:hypothetical protein TVAG_230600 [Trichomonas vaginalis G3]|uniref:Coiled-coil domain-containing protein 22 homolog n=1 Tax=Trichomonas vaginalis (strain ATCC PRA-98 / G3) TaxID=412133 RepID=A2EDY8_TRIV3|nr:protein of unknown function, DUF812 family [Trichomonas vaginalis G3]EAY09100.1 hypothetical protein TVAG_230600 [Trichomonas vaginalis G3]KAI5502668.1 protein of unknown function, DUF812 family [Trichomonas vaginalis G3]|eukprot:XP_001321323.1 hypothetical protein [Trichomonas vaginalis G3]